MQEAVYHKNFEVEDEYFWFVGRNAIVAKLIDELCCLNNNDEVLDIGTGTGGFATLLSEKYSVIGLDTSPVALEYCRKRGLRNLFLGTLDEFPAGELNIKAAVMLDVIEHIDDDSGIVKQVYDMLPAGGFLIATVPAYRWMWSQHDVAHMHKRRYNMKNFRKLLTNAGFDLKFTSYINTFLFIPAVLKRFVDKLNPATKRKDETVDEVPAGINTLFTKIFLAEGKLLPAIKYPFGLTIVAIARKS